MRTRALRRYHLRRTLASAVWVIPLACLLAGIGLAEGATAIDRAADYKLVGQHFTGTATDVQQMLSTAAGALVSLMSIVLSLTLVAVQLAMAQFSPRIVRSLFQDRRNQLAIGAFVGTFAYTMLVIRDVDDQNNLVPGLSVVLAYVLMLVSIAGLFLFVQHATQSIRVAGIIDLVGDETHAELSRLEPLEEHPLADPDPRVITAPESAIVNLIREDALVGIAAEADVVLEIVPSLGHFVACDAPLVRIRGDLPEQRREEVLDCIVLESERTHEDDPSYGLRKLVDIVARSIASSPFDDPTTAVQALHRVHDCMRVLATRKLPDGEWYDGDGVLRLVYPTLGWEGYVRLACDEPRLAGAGSPQVARRLRAMLEDLQQVAPDDRQEPLERQLELLDAGVRRSYDDESDVDEALVADEMGLGAGPDVRSDLNGNRPAGMRQTSAHS